MNIKNSWLINGFADEHIDDSIDLVSEINRLKQEKNAVILAHYYQKDEIQDIADVVGDSLALAQQATQLEADVFVMSGVHFMAETVKILNPSKKVLLPDMHAGCSLAESCPYDDFKLFVEAHPDHKVISYVNTSAAVKTLTDVVVTSSNARQIVESFPKDEKLIFAPDRNLGNYINSVTGRNMLLWDGACHVHEQFSLEKILDLKNQYPQAKILAHPECQRVVLNVADYIGSTLALLNYSKTSDATQFIVATESGILHEMKKASPQKEFIPAPPLDSTCGCNDCNFMKMNTLKKMYLCLKNEFPFIEIDETVRLKAEKPIRKMLEMSKK
ncbi:quinolinate synthase NadA [Microbacter margulisiae]|uniref:Quinolinate synthase n=1 Tax=Microbacter margulisiae TaxID=1350067 RepID=A0A7W5DU02_9PORP|nr:quinolinate synthase NadA [Microbacter margulisiae]MBB3188678.1 quinolinate synthase [Microbacter margulisiae]